MINIPNLKYKHISISNRIPLETFAANRCRDSIMKIIYEYIFEYLLDKANKMMSSTEIKKKRITILDIPGFGKFYFAF